MGGTRPAGTPNTGSVRSCPHCSTVCDAATALTPGTQPDAGDISICLYCCGLALFTEEMDLRLPDAQELEALLTDATITEALRKLAPLAPGPRS